MYTTTVLCLFVLAAAFECSAEIVLMQKDGLSKIVHHKDNFFIADKNNVYRFDSGFEILKEQEVNKACGNTCNNTFTVALVDELNDHLILCGTHHNGLCEKRNTSDLRQLGNISEAIPTTDSLSVQGVVTYVGGKSYLTIARTLDPSAVSDSNTKIIRKYEIEKSFSHVNDFVSLGKHLTIFYRSAFSSENYTYFFTNQFEDTSQANYTSKITRMCDEVYTTFFDTPIQCEGYESYNLVQDALLVDVNSSKRLYITFLKGTPTEQTGDSIICFAEMKNITEELMELQESAVICRNNFDYEYPYLFKPSSSRECLNSSSDFSAIECQPGPPTFRSGKDPVKTNFLSKTNIEEGYITTLSTTTLESNPVIIAGTSKGFILKYVIDTSGFIKFKFPVQVNNQRPIKSVFQIDEEWTYASTTTKVYKFPSTICSEFTSCSATMEGKNPLCGWCVYSQSATRRNDCTYMGSLNHWLSALSKCPSLQLQPTGIPIGTNKRVTLIVENLPERLENYKYFCQVGDGQVLVPVIEGNRLSCDIVGKNEHKEVSMRLVVNHNQENILIAEAPFLFYNCSTYNRCGKCVETFGANCTWHPDNGTCSWSFWSEADRPKRVNQVSDCPRLERIHSKYIPSGVDTNLTLEIGNLNDILQGERESSRVTEFSIHVGSLKSKPFGCSNVTNGSIICSIIGTTNIEKKIMTLQIYYNSGGNNVYLDNPNSINVTVYNCSKLSQGKCNYCNALKSDYICHWPSTEEGCVYGQSVSAGYTCTRPEITKILPRDGLTGEGTKITVYGNEFGGEKDIINFNATSDDKNPNVVNKKCVTDIKSNYVRNMKDPEDFSLRVRESFQCELKQFNPVTPNITKFFMNNATIESDKIQPWVVLPIWKGPKDVYVLSIEPKKGPARGGTVISFTGKNLGIGNRVIEGVLFYFEGGRPSNRNCIHSKIKPELTPEMLPM